jgi:hypothetical protein
MSRFDFIPEMPIELDLVDETELHDGPDLAHVRNPTDRAREPLSDALRPGVVGGTRRVRKRRGRFGLGGC